MQQRVPVTDLVRSLDAYSKLAGSLGFQVNRSAVRKHALEGTDYRGPMKSFFSESYASRHASHTAPAGVLRAIRTLHDDLASVVRERLNGALPGKAQTDAAALVQGVAGLPSEKRAAAAEAVARSPQARFLKRAEMDIKEFHRMVRKYAGGQTIARARLVAHMCEELSKLGCEMSLDAIEERFRANTKVRTVPACFAEILGRLDASFLTGLVAIEEMVGETPPDQWLEECRRKLGFRSHNAMHKALAESTPLNYEAIHKALTHPRPGQRIQRQICDTLREWQAAVEAGQTPPVDLRYLGAPASKVRELLVGLCRSHPKRQQLLRQAAAAMGVKSAHLRRTLSDPDDARTYPAEALAKLQHLVEEGCQPARPMSYLAGEGTRRLASQLSYRSNEALSRWRRDRENYALKRTYKSLRLQLIMAMKQRRTERDWVPMAPVDGDRAHDEVDEDAEV